MFSNVDKIQYTRTRVVHVNSNDQHETNNYYLTIKSCVDHTLINSYLAQKLIHVVKFD